LTFVQFLFVATTGYISQFDRTRAPLFLKPNQVPIRRWLINILLFFTINVLNNHAFSYNISVPIHIILRSGGSITTLIAGYLWGKRFTRMQIFAVTLLTIGVIVAAWSDQQSKVVGHSASQDRTNKCHRRALKPHRAFPRSALDLRSYSWPKCCRQSWDCTLKRPTKHTGRIGKKTYSTPSVLAIPTINEKAILQIGCLPAIGAAKL